MPKFVRLNEHLGEHSLSVPPDMTGLLRHEELEQLTWQFGSHINYTPGETIAGIEPPIPHNRVAEYGDMVVRLALRFEPDADIRFVYNQQQKRGAA